MTRLCDKQIRNVFPIVVCALLLCIIGFIYRENTDEKTPKNRLVLWENNSPASVKYGDKFCVCETDQLVLQRNNNSRWLNVKQQLNGQNRCQSLDKRKSAGERTSETGGWCPVATKTKHFGFDRKLVTTLEQVFKGKTVGSFGDGPGHYKKAILASKLVKVYDAYDGAPFCESTSNGLVKFLDLSIPQYGLPVYDWILSLEVAEHIPRQFEDIFLSNLIRHAREGVILSWAIPGQAGYSHVNNRDPQHVTDNMRNLGFEIDMSITKTVRNGTNIPNLRRNINVYIRKLEKSFCNLKCDA